MWFWPGLLNIYVPKHVQAGCTFLFEILCSLIGKIKTHPYSLKIILSLRLSLCGDTTEVSNSTVLPTPFPLSGLLPQLRVSSVVFASINAVRNVLSQILTARFIMSDSVASGVNGNGREDLTVQHEV